MLVTVDVSVVQDSQVGACRRVVEKFLTVLSRRDGRSYRGRIGVGSEKVKEMFVEAIEESKAGFGQDSEMRKELGRLRVEVLRVSFHVVSSMKPSMTLS